MQSSRQLESEYDGLEFTTHRPTRASISTSSSGSVLQNLLLGSGAGDTYTAVLPQGHQADADNGGQHTGKCAVCQ